MFANQYPTDMENDLHETQSNKNTINNIYKGLKKINPGLKRLFISLYIIGIGMLLFLLLDKYGLVEKFVIYIAIFTGFYCLIIAMILWIKDGFDKKGE